MKAKIAMGIGAAGLWTVALLWSAVALKPLPVFTLMPTIMLAFLAPGLVMAAMVGRIASRRFFDPDHADGSEFIPKSAGDIDTRVLRNTGEQMILALAIWPAAAVLLAGTGPRMIVTLGAGFAIARLAFWAGYHLSPSLRAFGFGATFYPTVAVGLWAVLRAAGMGA